MWICTIPSDSCARAPWIRTHGIFCVRLLQVCSFNEDGQYQSLRLWNGQQVRLSRFFCVYIDPATHWEPEWHTHDNMKKLVIVKGISNIGKTATLEALIKQLLASGYRPVVPQNAADVTSFLICEKDNHRVGVITFGDPSTEEDVEGCLNECLNHNCDTIFAASRTSGAVYDLLYRFASTNGFAPIETSPLRAYQYWISGIDIARLHDTFANMLMSLI